MREVNIIGVGLVRFGKYPEKTIGDLGAEACWNAIKDAGIKIKEIETAYCGHVFQGRVAGQQVFKEMGITGIQIINVENACASGSTAFRGAYLDVASGVCDIALALGVEMLSNKISGVIPPDKNDLEGLMGRTNPATYAMTARRHMLQYGTTVQQMAMVSVKNHKNGCLNPYSQYQKEVTLEEVMNSRMIADPLTLLHCCPTGDGAAALVLCSSNRARQYTNKPIKISACVLRSGGYVKANDDITTQEVTVQAAKKAYEIAGIGPEDVDFAEVHDAFSIGEIIQTEDLGFFKKGEGGRVVEEGVTEIHGKKPINTSGGLLTKGHPLGATGPAQIAEIVYQLRGEAGPRQVKNAKVGLSNCMGGVVFGLDAGIDAVTILQK